MAAAATLNPPFRFSMVEADLYRGGWPKPRNIPFLQRIKIKTVISLTPEPPIFPPEVQVIHFKIDKKALPLTSQKVTQILGLLGDSTLAPVYVHCLDGALTTSLFCMCLRKQLGWTPASIYSECSRFLDEFGQDELEFLSKYNGEVENDGVGWRAGLKRVQTNDPKALPIEEEIVEEVQVVSLNMSRTLQALDLDLGQRS